MFLITCPHASKSYQAEIFWFLNIIIVSGFEKTRLPRTQQDILFTITR